MSRLEYWFDGRKANSSQVKEKFQELMYKNGALTKQGTEVFDVIWGNTSLRKDLFPNINDPIIGRDKFEELLENHSTLFYSFLMTK